MSIHFSRTTILLSLVAMISLSGCATQQYHDLYKGDKQSGAVIQSAETVLVESINGQDVGGGFVGQTHEYEIAPGHYTLIVTYADFFEMTADDFEKVKSGPVKLIFTAEAGKSYRLTHPMLDGLEASREFAKKPALEIVEQGTGKAIEFAIEYSMPKRLLPKIRFASEEEKVFASDYTPAKPEPVKPAESKELSPLKMLQFSWQQASEEERAAFLDWIKQ